MELQIDSKDLDFHQLIEYAMNSIWIIGTEGKILYGNRACLELLKLNSLEDILSKSFYGFLHPDLRDTYQEQLRRVLKKHERIELMESKMIRSDGKAIDVEVKIGG